MDQTISHERTGPFSLFCVCFWRFCAKATNIQAKTKALCKEKNLCPALENICNIPTSTSKTQKTKVLLAAFLFRFFFRRIGRNDTRRPPVCRIKMSNRLRIRKKSAVGTETMLWRAVSIAQKHRFVYVSAGLKPGTRSPLGTHTVWDGGHASIWNRISLKGPKTTELFFVAYVTGEFMTKQKQSGQFRSQFDQSGKAQQLPFLFLCSHRSKGTAWAGG